MRHLALVLIAVAGGGCTAHGPGAAVSSPEMRGMPQAPNIELLGFPNCPNTPAMRENLHAALRSIGGGLTFRDVNQEALAESDDRRGWPAPTVLVNGQDLFEMPTPTTPSAGCRVYEGGIPPPDSIASRLRSRLGDGKRE